MEPIVYAPAIGKIHRCKPKKRMRKMANNTGGIPWNKIQLVEKLRNHFGHCGQDFQLNVVMVDQKQRMAHKPNYKKYELT